MQKSFFDSFRAAFSGIAATVVLERNMRIHLSIFSLVLIFEIITRPALLTVVIVFLVSSMVLSLELVNTAVEAAVDLICQGQQHELARLAKDAAAGSVLIGAIASLTVALYILWSLWPLHFLLWSKVHWFGMLLNVIVLIACLATLLCTNLLAHRGVLAKSRFSEGGDTRDHK